MRGYLSSAPLPVCVGSRYTSFFNPGALEDSANAARVSEISHNHRRTMVVVQALVQALAWTLHTAPHPTLYTPSPPTLLTPPGRSVGLVRAAELVRGAPPFGELLEDSIYPEWPEAAVRGKRELSTVLTSFVHVATSVPLDAASDPGEPSKRAIQAWLDGGFEAHKFIHRSISRGSYVEVLGCLQCVLAQCQAAYPDLWAVLQFVPKKNGLNPVLSLLASEEGGPAAVSIEHLKPRQVRR